MIKRVKKPAQSEAEKAEVKKTKRLTQKLMTHLIISLVVLGALVGVMMAATSMQENAAKQKDTAQNDLNNIQNETNSLNKQIEDLGAASQIYADLTEKRATMEFAIAPQAVREIVASLKEEYLITTLNLEFSNQEAFALPELVNTQASAIKMRGTMNLGGLSDQYVYQFIDTLRRTFPGIVIPQTIALERRQPISIDVLSQISLGNPIETVQGKLEFDWYGFIPKAETETDKPASDQGVPADAPL